MADRTSAGLFAKIFELLAQNPTDEHKRIAQEIYSYTGEYDFSDYQMGADEACLTLGIARKGIHPDYPEDGEMILFPNDPGFDNAKVQARDAGSRSKRK